MTKQVKKNTTWEERFDDRYKYEREFDGDELMGLNFLKSDTKDFIRSLLSSQLSDLKKEINGMKSHYGFIVIKKKELLSLLDKKYGI